MGDTADLCADLVLLCVQPRMLHVNSVSDAIENVTLMYCPPDRRVKVEVPLKVCGQARHMAITHIFLQIGQAKY